MEKYLSHDSLRTMLRGCHALSHLACRQLTLRVTSEKKAEERNYRKVKMRMW